MGRSTPPPRDVLVGVHVLVVDDDSDARHIIRTVLEYCGALVTPAASAEQALGVLAKVVPDVMIVEIALPERDGFWLLSEIRKRPRTRGGAVPVLVCTGFEENYPVARLQTAGFQRVLSKPIDPWDLARAVETLAHQR